MAGTNKGFRIFANIIMILLMLCCLLPFILLITASITDEATLTLYGYSFFPRKINFRAYEYLFQAAGKIARAYGVTILVTLVGTTLNVTMTMFMAYLLSKQDLREGISCPFSSFSRCCFPAVWFLPILFGASTCMWGTACWDCCCRTWRWEL